MALVLAVLLGEERPWRRASSSLEAALPGRAPAPGPAPDLLVPFVPVADAPARRGGGSPEDSVAAESSAPIPSAASEAAEWPATVATPGTDELALRWLVRHQSEDGHWDPCGFGAGCTDLVCPGAGSRELEVGVTAIATEAFLASFYTPQNRASYVDPVDGKTRRYGETVRRAMKWLIERQDDAGSFRGSSSAGVFEQALATLTLADAYGITNAVAYRAPAAKAVSCLATGLEGARGEALFVAVLALETAKVSGLDVDAEALARAHGALDAEPPASGADALGRYQATRAFIVTQRARRDETWRTWTVALRDSLVAEQRRDQGCLDGSWDPLGGLGWDAAGGRVWVTAWDLLTLGSLQHAWRFSWKKDD